MSGISTALLSEYEEDADGADEAAKAALLEVFAGGYTKESHWLTHRLLWAVTWAARDVPTNALQSLHMHWADYVIPRCSAATLSVRSPTRG